MTPQTTGFFSSSLGVVRPPRGARNVLLGQVVEGPGGVWIPCATEFASGLYYPGLFQVGPGQKQVCVTDRSAQVPEHALELAVHLAKLAAD